MTNSERFIKILKEETYMVGDPRFVFDTMELGEGDSAWFYFKLGSLSEDFSLKMDFLELDDFVLMKYNAVKLVDRAYKYLIRKVQIDYRRISRDLVSVIRNVVEESPINGFEVIDVKYYQLTALVTFKIFNFEEKYEIDLSLMSSFGGSRKYAEYVVGRVIGNGADNIAYRAKKGL